MKHSASEINPSKVHVAYICSDLDLWLLDPDVLSVHLCANSFYP